MVPPIKKWLIFRRTLLFEDPYYSRPKSSCLDSLTTYNLQSLSYLDSKLYPGFCHAHDVIIKKEYQGCPLMNSPITCTKTRSKSVDLQSDDFLKKKFSKVHSIHM